MTDVTSSLPDIAPFNAPETRAVFAALNAEGGEARLVGGCVRNALMGLPVTDADLATTHLPEHSTSLLEAAGFRVVPTGLSHGTVTAVMNGVHFEITTLRRDVSTDGRRATVAFTTDWREDAARRDFTFNALYADARGRVYDYGGGLADLAVRRVRFIGDAATRIAEDHLRLLRFFRFHACYGAGEADAAGLAACAAAKDSLSSLSGERLHAETLKLLAAPDPGPALRLMAATGVLSALLPEPLAVKRALRLIACETDELFSCDAFLRLIALIGSAAGAEETIRRLRLSNDESARLRAAFASTEKIVSYLSIREVRRALYRIGPQSFKDLVMLRWAEDPKESSGVQWRALLALAASWQRPSLPLTGHEVMAAGVPSGPQVGRVLAEVEDWWIDSDFTDDRFSLIERLKAIVQATIY